MLSLGAGLAQGRFHARVRPAILLERAEVVFGLAALLAAGGSLGGEADRSEEPLPVHPRAVSVTIEGCVLDAVASDAAHPAITLRAASVRVGDGSAACGSTLLVRFGDGPPPKWANPGMWIRFDGDFRPPEDARNPGASAPGRWLTRLGIAGAVDADPSSVVVLGDPGNGGVPWSALLRLRLARLFSRDLSGPVAALARGMALGDRSGISPAVRDAFRDGGTIHILSISGLHVCVLAGIVAALAVALRLQAMPALWLELGSLWGYVLLVGAPASAVRSAILWTAMKGARLRGSATRPFAAWGIAGLLLHLWDPTVLSDPGFQLSFAAVLGLLASGGVRLTPGSRVARGILALGQQSAFAEAGTLGIQVFHFGAVPVAGLALNLAVIPICGAFMAAMLVHLACAFLLPPLAPAAAGAVEVSGLLMLGITTKTAAAIPPVPARSLPSLGVVAACLSALLVAAAVWEHARVERRGRDLRYARGFALAALLLAWIAPFLPATRTRDRSVWLLALDVGQGDAAIAHAPGATVLVDAGPATESRDEGRSAVEPALRAERITRVDLAILSHAHRDHYGGLAWLSGRGFLGPVLENGSDPRGAWRDPHAAWVPIRSDTSLVAGGVRIRTLGSPRAGAGDMTGNAGENNRSLVAFLRAGGSVICFAGDVERDAEGALLGSLEPARVMKVPHHGSKTSSDSAWIAAVRPRIAIISCGERNRFGHPDPATVGRYLRCGARVLRTDQEGAIRVTLTEGGALVSTRAHPAPERVSWNPDSALTPSVQSP